MLNPVLKISLVVATIIFFSFIAFMVNKKKLELSATLTWLFTGFILIVFAVFDGIVQGFANLLHIDVPANAMFMAVLCFILLICFTEAISISRNNKQIRRLSQELALMKKVVDKTEEILYNKKTDEKNEATERVVEE